MLTINEEAVLEAVTKAAVDYMHYFANFDPTFSQREKLKREWIAPNFFAALGERA